MFRFYPAIMSYLGYCPIPSNHPPRNLGQAVRLYRKHRGMSQKEAADIAGVDATTLAKIEASGEARSEQVRSRIIQFIRTSTRGWDISIAGDTLYMEQNSMDS